MRKTLSLLLAVVMMISGISFASAEGADYTVQTTGVWDGQEQVGSMDLRFYPAAPHVPYYGMKAYVAFMRNVDLTVTPLDGGIWEVANPNGSSVLVNPSAGTMEAADWAWFQLPPLPYTNLTGVKDSACAWTYYSEIVFDDDPPAAVTFDFAKYGIGVYADPDDVYLQTITGLARKGMEPRRLLHRPGAKAKGILHEELPQARRASGTYCRYRQ